MSCPRKIQEPAGKRIKLILGDTGSDYIFFCNNDDGNRKWQGRAWNFNKGISGQLTRQINEIVKTGRDIIDIASGPKGEWYFNGVKQDGSGNMGCWTGMSSTFDSSINEKGFRERVCIGDEKRWIIYSNSSYRGENLGDDLSDHLNQILGENRHIDFIWLLPSKGYFVSDSNSKNACWGNINNGYLLAELLDTSADHITDVVVSAGDGSWIVLRENSYTASSGISEELLGHLKRFYTLHKARVCKRNSAIRDYVQEQARKKRELEKEEKILNERERRYSAIQKKMVHDRILDIASKKLKVGDHVTVLGHSKKAGDGIVLGISNDGVLTLRLEQQILSVLPNKVLLPNVLVQDMPKELLLACKAQDKYEAAVALYHCRCDEASCLCTKAADDVNLFPPQDQQASQSISTGTRVFVKDLAFATVIEKDYYSHHIYDKGLIKIQYDDRKTYHVKPQQLQLQYISACQFFSGENSTNTDKVPHFDLYKCIEKIDMKRLKQIKRDLATDSLRREQEQQWNRSSINRKKLRLCRELEAIVNALYEYVKDLPCDANGFVEYEVHYEHKDSSARGRLFAKGLQVKLKNNDCPRTITLQGMYKDLRAPLVGSFAHDIDCVNSEVALLCSLAIQMGMKDSVPTLFDYRDNWGLWISSIRSAHGVSESDAKLLSTIVLNGGQYDSWKRAVSMNKKNTKNNKQIQEFVFRLKSEVAVLRTKLLQHPKFSWTKNEKEKFQQRRGISNDDVLDSLLLPRIIESCENEVLNIIHRCFFDNSWIVRAKIFDGLIVEKSDRSASSLSLEQVMKNAEACCESQGWYVELAEKPLHGKQDDPISIIEEAREAVYEEILCLPQPRFGGAIFNI